VEAVLKLVEVIQLAITCPRQHYNCGLDREDGAASRPTDNNELMSEISA
jgi:hypothetical protein